VGRGPYCPGEGTGSPTNGFSNKREKSFRARKESKPGWGNTKKSELLETTFLGRLRGEKQKQKESHQEKKLDNLFVWKNRFLKWANKKMPKKKAQAHQTTKKNRKTGRNQTQWHKHTSKIRPKISQEKWEKNRNKKRDYPPSPGENKINPHNNSQPSNSKPKKTKPNEKRTL